MFAINRTQPSKFWTLLKMSRFNTNLFWPAHFATSMTVVIMGWNKDYGLVSLSLAYWGSDDFRPLVTLCFFFKCPLITYQSAAFVFYIAYAVSNSYLLYSNYCLLTHIQTTTHITPNLGFQSTHTSNTMNSSFSGFIVYSFLNLYSSQPLCLWLLHPFFISPV